MIIISFFVFLFRAWLILVLFIPIFPFEDDNRYQSNALDLFREDVMFLEISADPVYIEYS